MALTAEYVRSRLEYDPDTGVFLWRAREVRPAFSRTDRGWNTKYAGTVAGSPSGKGYILIGLDWKLYKAHRLAWFYTYGEWPSAQLDHRDTVRSHNWISNLREATNQQNSGNCFASRNSASGIKGVYFHRQCRRWCAQIKTDGRMRHLGLFPTVEEAAAAYAEAARGHFGDYARAA